MVSNANQDNRRRPVNQGVGADTREPNKIGASTPYDFSARNLTAYGGLLPVATMLENLGFQQLIEETDKSTISIGADVFTMMSWSAPSWRLRSGCTTR